MAPAYELVFLFIRAQWCSHKARRMSVWSWSSCLTHLWCMLLPTPIQQFPHQQLLQLQPTIILPSTSGIMHMSVSNLFLSRLFRKLRKTLKVMVNLEVTSVLNYWLLMVIRLLGNKVITCIFTNFLFHIYVCCTVHTSFEIPEWFH